MTLLTMDSAFPGSASSLGTIVDDPAAAPTCVEAGQAVGDRSKSSAKGYALGASISF